MYSKFYRREKDAFFSYSHADRDLANSIVEWLRSKARIDVWLDANELDGGRPVRTELQGAIQKCRSLILLLTPSSIESSWVAQEGEAANEEMGRYPGFRTVVLLDSKVDEDDIPDRLRSITHVRIPENGLDGRVASKLLASLRLGASGYENNWDVFVTRTWREDEPAYRFANRVCKQLTREGFRLIGDEPRYDSCRDRLRAIISSCGAYVAIVPPREPSDLQWLLDDVSVAMACGVPSFILVPPEVMDVKTELQDSHEAPVSFDPAVEVFTTSMKDGPLDDSVKADLQRLVRQVVDEYKEPLNPYSVFYAGTRERISPEERKDVNRIVERITGRKCVYPDDIEGQDLQRRTLQEVRDAVTIVADVVEADVDTWILAGVARGAGLPVHLIAREARSVVLPELFQDNRPRLYGSHVDRLGLVHASVYPHRRWFMNQEVSRW